MKQSTAIKRALIQRYDYTDIRTKNYIMSGKFLGYPSVIGDIRHYWTANRNGGTAVYLDHHRIATIAGKVTSALNYDTGETVSTK
jgi:hypothetical protein